MNDAPEADEELVYVADSIDEFIQRTRWQQIQEARRDARDALREAPVQRANLQRQTSYTEADEAVRQTARAAVESYVMEVERLFHETEPGQKLWTDTEVAVVPARQCFVVDATPDELELEKIQFSSYPAPSGDPDMNIQIGGVEDWMALSDTRVRYTLRGDVQVGRTKRVKEHTETATVTTPLSATKEVYRATNALVEQVGPGMEIGRSDSGTVEGSYAELLEAFDDET